MAQTEHLVEATYLRKIGRNIGKVDDTQLDAFITEAEQMYIKPALGDSLFLALLDDDAENDETYGVLLNGGTYTDDNENSYYLKGLRTALSYYVYAQNIMVGDFQSTRYGMVVKNDDYSTHLQGKERSDAYGNALEVANNYLKECVAYCKRKGLIKHRMGSSHSAGNVRIRKIG